MSDREEKTATNELDQEILAEDVLEEKRRRGIKFLPNAITTCAMFFGFLAVMMAINGNFLWACWALAAAGVCDLLDGRVARLTKSTSSFGMEYDSLSDLIAFGFAPAMISYFWALEAFGRLGWAAAFIYVACAAIRLAKFNTLTGQEESRRYFRGIPSPGAAGMIIVMVMIYKEGEPLPPDAFLARGGMLIWTIGMSLLMVSNVRFRTFKDINIKRFGPVFPLVGLALIIAVFMAKPYYTLFAVSMAYLAIGLIEGGIIFRRRESELREERKRLRKQRRIQRKLDKKKAKEARREEKKKDSPFRAIR